jgi:AraC-like DNA-binding protein
MSPFLDVGDISVSRSRLSGTLKQPKEDLNAHDQIFEKVTVHFATTCAGVPRLSGGLAPWQCRRARNLMLQDLADCPTLSHLAAACGLSSRHFLRAFKKSNGVSPHRWLLIARVDRACELLENTPASIADIAHACGFADQSHLTRVFRGLVGAAPGAWRRARSCDAVLEGSAAAVDGLVLRRTGTGG